MSIERIKGKVSFLCDLEGCGNGLETDWGDFGEGKYQAREEGWQFRKREGTWKHFCCDSHAEMEWRGQGLIGKVRP